MLDKPDDSESNKVPLKEFSESSEATVSKIREANKFNNRQHTMDPDGSDDSGFKLMNGAEEIASKRTSEKIFSDDISQHSSDSADLESNRDDSTSNTTEGTTNSNSSNFDQALQIAKTNLTQNQFGIPERQMLAYNPGDKTADSASTEFSGSRVRHLEQARFDSEQRRLKEFVDKDGKWDFTNKSDRDIAGKIKEFLWNSLNPAEQYLDRREIQFEQGQQDIARNNLEFAGQFLMGSGADYQPHYDSRDPVLQDFMRSPGANAIREQYGKLGNPEVTRSLGYSTMQAAFDTAFPRPTALPPDGYHKPPLGDPGLPYTVPDYGSVAFQVGGFGNPPAEYPWATAMAYRCEASGNVNPKGDHVTFQVVNIAGKKSFEYHGPMVKDKPPGAEGPERSIIQVFRWIEPIPKPKN